MTRRGSNAKDVFSFMGERCDRVVQNVFNLRIENHSPEAVSAWLMQTPDNEVHGRLHAGL
jgi:hypothetical protein